MMHSLNAPAQWLANELNALLSAPTVVVEDGPGPEVAASEEDQDPADLFTTRFEHVFMRHARGLVGGREVDREELKKTLMVLRKRWNASDCRWMSCKLHYSIEGFHPEMGVKMEFTSSGRSHTIVWEACVSKQRNGRPRIKTLLLEGDPELFEA
ncbi:hypothetical protein BC835DRAFT_1355121 [Cytidiella melzeri]|nr:hypothetical protein BC835DRAFT_1355121 [Cytidiella melzeri]